MVIAWIIFFIKETCAEYGKHLNLSSELKVTKSCRAVFLNLCVTTQIWVTKLFWVNHKTIICMMILLNISFFHSNKNLKCRIYYNDICFVFYTCLYLLLGVMRQSHWPIPGCSSNTIRGRSEGQWSNPDNAFCYCSLLHNTHNTFLYTVWIQGFTWCLVWTTSAFHTTRKIYIQIQSD
jgi:hypothetical protein